MAAGGQHSASTKSVTWRRLIEKQPDATLDELCEAVEHKRRVRVSRPTMSRLLQRLDLSRKKSHPTPVSETLKEF